MEYYESFSPEYIPNYYTYETVNQDEISITLYPSKIDGITVEGNYRSYASFLRLSCNKADPLDNL